MPPGAGPLARSSSTRTPAPRSRTWRTPSTTSSAWAPTRCSSSRRRGTPRARRPPSAGSCATRVSRCARPPRRAVAQGITPGARPLAAPPLPALGRRTQELEDLTRWRRAATGLFETSGEAARCSRACGGAHPRAISLCLASARTLRPLQVSAEPDPRLRDDRASARGAGRRSGREPAAQLFRAGRSEPPPRSSRRPARLEACASARRPAAPTPLPRGCAASRRGAGRPSAGHGRRGPPRGSRAPSPPAYRRRRRGRTGPGCARASPR